MKMQSVTIYPPGGSAQTFTVGSANVISIFEYAEHGIAIHYSDGTSKHFMNCTAVW